MAKTAIVLASGDNVGVVTGDIRPGSDIVAGSLTLVVKDAVPFGHKIALALIAPGEPIVKFNVPIGRATSPIAPGDHVHIHNVESIYINNAVDHYED